jgi:23S rRNA pseudouridine1911/1915/1917 synthase
VRKGKPHIPPGAPGHPREASEAPKGRANRFAAPRGERLPLEEPPPNPRRARSDFPVRAAKARLVYEDEDILAYDKPAGLSVIAAEGSRARSLLDVASDEVRRHNPKGRAALVHRIDRDTSGTVVFAMSARIKRELMGAWDELVSERRYVALVEGSMGGRSGSCDSWLKENKAGGVFRAGIGERGAKRAITRWRVLGEGSGLSLLELFLETGRKHQIRVQLADLGHPVVGDPRYGRPVGRGTARDDLSRLCLHAASIELAMPGRGKKLRIESPVPPEFAAALESDPKGARDAKREELNARHAGKKPPSRS